MQFIQSCQLGNGLWVLTERIPDVRSLAMTWLLPAGAVYEPEDQQGIASVLGEMICRGAGNLDARAHSDALEMLGVQRDTQLMSRHLRLSAAMIGDKVTQALPLLFDMVRYPRLLESTLAPSVDLALQSLDALQDEAQDRVLVELRQRHYAPPLNRSTLGVREHLLQLNIQQVHHYHQRTFVPQGSILALAGNLDPEPVTGLIREYLGDWKGRLDEPVVQGTRRRGYHHQICDSHQLHLGLAYDMPSEADPQSMLVRVAVQVLSGGASSRLFTEVREKRGLCYWVGARYGGDRQQGSVFGYLGTTPAKGRQTMEVLRAELQRLGEGVEEAEFRRAVVGMKSSLVMQGESTAARAMALASDQYIHGRPRSLDEVAQQVDDISLDAMNEFLRDHPPGEMTVVTLGPDGSQLM